MAACLVLPQMRISQGGYFPATGCAHQVAFHNQERFINFFNGSRVFTHRGCNGSKARPAPPEFIDDGGKDFIVHFVQPVFIHIQGCQGILGNGQIDGAVSFYLGKIPDAS